MPKGQAQKIKTYDDLAGLRIGTITGSKYFVRFDQDEQLIKEAAPQASNNYKKLVLGRLDAVVQDEANGIELIHRHGLAQDIEMAHFRFSREKHVYFGISKTAWMMEERDRITQVLEEMITSGRIKAILRAYYMEKGLPVPSM